MMMQSIEVNLDDDENLDDDANPLPVGFVKKMNLLGICFLSVWWLSVYGNMFMNSLAFSLPPMMIWLANG